MKFAVIIIISFVGIWGRGRSEVTLKNNGYDNVIVAIHNSVKEDITILDNIKELFLSASRFLYVATRKRAYFRSVTISLPAHWSNNDDYISSTGNYFPEAHLRVDAANPDYGDEPYTLQPGGCGEPGRYIHLSTDYVRSLFNANGNEYGPPGRRLVYEWARFRYGVFEESGDPDDPKYPVMYREGRSTYGTACVRSIRGSAQRPEGETCDIIEGSDVGKGCIFIPFEDNEVKASIMFKPYVPSIDSFCDQDNHNPNAPNRHNAMCKSLSVWEVMAKHKDFANNNNPPSSLNEKELETEFRIVKAKSNDKGRYVLVLDVSGSMLNKPIQLLREASTRLIRDVIPDGAFLGLVCFSDTGHILSPLIKVNSENRLKLINSLPTRADGKTAIGQGLLMGAEALESNGNITEGAVIVLLTDGQENVKPHVDDVVPSLIQKKIVVNCIAFGADASNKLENLTEATGGKSFLVIDVSGHKPITGLDNAFRESVTATVEEELQPVILVQDDIEMFNSYTELGVELDPELGLNTIFSLDIADRNENSINMTIIGPKGHAYGPGNGSQIYSVDKDHIKIAIPTEAEAGTYSVAVSKGTSNPVSASLSVTSEPRNPEEQPIRVRSWLSDVQVFYPGTIRVFAEVRKGYDPVLGATVSATIRQASSLQEIVLRDNGVGADVRENDGVYSGYVTHFFGNGRYGVVTKVTNAGNAKMKHVTSSRDNRIRKVRSVVTFRQVIAQEESEANLYPFQRIAEAGTFLVENWKPEFGDIVPPNSVRDLMVIRKEVLSGLEKYVTLIWTSSGNDLDVGQADFVELRISCSKEELTKKFRDAYLLDEEWVRNGSLRAELGGQQQVITVEVPRTLANNPNCSAGSYESFYFALSIHDYVGNVGEPSVVASAHFVEPSEHQPQIKLEWVIGGSLVALALIILMVILSLKMTKRKRKIEPMYGEQYL